MTNNRKLKVSAGLISKAENGELRFDPFACDWHVGVGPSICRWYQLPQHTFELIIENGVIIKDRGWDLKGMQCVVSYKENSSYGTNILTLNQLSLSRTRYDSRRELTGSFALSPSNINMLDFNASPGEIKITVYGKNDQTHKLLISDVIMLSQDAQHCTFAARALGLTAEQQIYGKSTDLIVIDEVLDGPIVVARHTYGEAFMGLHNCCQRSLVCDCGGSKCNTFHADWCSINRKEVENG